MGGRTCLYGAKDFIASFNPKNMVSPYRMPKKWLEHGKVTTRGIVHVLDDLYEFVRYGADKTLYTDNLKAVYKELCGIYLFINPNEAMRRAKMLMQDIGEIYETDELTEEILTSDFIKDARVVRCLLCGGIRTKEDLLVKTAKQLYDTYTDTYVGMFSVDEACDTFEHYLSIITSSACSFGEKLHQKEYIIWAEAIQKGSFI